ncbi:hypothetical protein EVAR_44983_1 [Eumeta japonica]|uniref:Uncharacterized protein n=1 Tax=Eumeta variegata TaxID=151549 RepID=A0A4C1XI66_EUMVA|nr:hypothetical protein EVAR_44983_1 [Eumeta japonica]
MIMAHSNEHLLNNALCDDFQQMLRPYYWTQRLLCASKYSIKDNFVLPNSRAYCAVAVFLLCFVTSAYVAVFIEVASTFIDSLVALQEMIEWAKDTKVTYLVQIHTSASSFLN